MASQAAERADCSGSSGLSDKVSWSDACGTLVGRCKGLGWGCECFCLEFGSSRLEQSTLQSNVLIREFQSWVPPRKTPPEEDNRTKDPDIRV